MSFLKKLVEETPEKFHTFLDRLEKVLQVARGRVDIKSRLNLLLDPDKPQTSTYLSAGQVLFVANAHFTGNAFPIFEPLKDYANQLELSLISYEGRGIDASVKLVSALEAMKVLQNTGLPTKQKDKD